MRRHRTADPQCWISWLREKKRIFENSDTTSILDKFIQTRVSNRIVGAIGLKFYYLERKNRMKLYFGLRFIPEYILNNKLVNNYIESTYIGNFDRFVGVRNDFVEPTIDKSKFTGNVEMSFGMVYNKVSLEIFFRRAFRYESSRNLGAMISYRINERMKIKNINNLRE